MVSAGYQFVNWTDDNGFVTTTANPLIVSNVTASQNIIANYAPNENFTITFLAGAHVVITGSNIQTVRYGGSTTQVTAVPSAGTLNLTGELSSAICKLY